MRIVKDFLVENFGRSAEGIRNIDNPYIGGSEYKQAKFLVREDGGLFVICGGDALVSFSLNGNIRASVMLVRNDSEGQKWECEQRTREGCNPTRIRPSAVLELVLTT